MSDEWLEGGGGGREGEFIDLGTDEFWKEALGDKCSHFQTGGEY